MAQERAAQDWFFCSFIIASSTALLWRRYEALMYRMPSVVIQLLETARLFTRSNSISLNEFSCISNAHSTFCDNNYAFSLLYICCSCHIHCNKLGPKVQKALTSGDPINPTDQALLLCDSISRTLKMFAFYHFHSVITLLGCCLWSTVS